jgi:hypothetical protein
MKTRRVIRIISIAIFFFFLCSPKAHKRWHFVQYASLTENRLKTPRPKDWKTLFEPGGSYAHKYEEYFNDNYGLRDLFIRLKNQVDFWLFRQSEKVVIGRDDWLFYKSVLEEQEIQTEKVPLARFEIMFARFQKLNRWLADRGITLVIVPCPMNNSIYPEMVPANTARRPSPTGFQRYREFLQKHPEILSIDPSPQLLRLKDTWNVFHKTDWHWTDPAGAHVARDLVNLLGQKSGMGNLWDQPINLKTKVFTGGGENNALALLWPIREQYLVLDNAGMKGVPREFGFSQDFTEWHFRSKLPSDSKLLPPTVMFGDSYGDAFLRAGFLIYFRSFQKFYNYRLKEEIGHIPGDTRFLIFQQIEVNLNALLGDSIWPDEILHN